MDLSKRDPKVGVLQWMHDHWRRDERLLCLRPDSRKILLDLASYLPAGFDRFPAMSIGGIMCASDRCQTPTAAWDFIDDVVACETLECVDFKPKGRFDLVFRKARR